MSDQAGSGGRERAAPADLPYVDGRDRSSAELREEIAKETDPQIQHLEEVREELGGIAEELGHRINPHSWFTRVLPAVGAGLALAVGLLALLRRRRMSHRDRDRGV